jgi:hypothetical protein
MNIFKSKRLPYYPEQRAFEGTSEPLEVVRLMEILLVARDLLQYLGGIRTAGGSSDGATK